MNKKIETKQMTARELHERLKANRRRPATPEQIEEYNKIVERDYQDTEKEKIDIDQDKNRKIAHPLENEL